MNSTSTASRSNEPMAQVRRSLPPISPLSAHANLPITIDSKWETVTIKFPSEVPAGDAKVHFKFTGKLNDKMRGFYRSAYKDSAGTEHWLASTQFEVGARVVSM